VEPASTKNSISIAQANVPDTTIQYKSKPKDCEIFSDNQRVDRMLTETPNLAFSLFGFSQPIFCRIYKEDQKMVNAAIASIMPRIGMPVKSMDINNGFFVTDEMQRGNMLNTWKDSYNITTQKDGNETVVRVLRNLFTARNGPWEMEKSGGNNEKFILTLVSDALASGSIQATSPAPEVAGGGAVKQDDLETKMNKLQALRDKKMVSEEEYSALRKKALDDAMGK
jgi:hypothetical protein